VREHVSFKRKFEAPSKVEVHRLPWPKTPHLNPGEKDKNEKATNDDFIFFYAYDGHGKKSKKK
jgi:hypothetical protein